MNKLSPSRLATCVALYDWDIDISINDQASILHRILRERGLDPSYYSLSHGDKQKRCSRSTFERLERSEGPGATGFTLYRFRERKLDFIEGWDVYAAAPVCIGRAKTLHIAIDIDGRLWKREASSILGCLSKDFPGAYGIGFQYPFRCGPSYFLNDIFYRPSLSDECTDQERRVRLWYQERLDLLGQDEMAPFRHKLGKIRAVYPVNLLNCSQLQSNIRGHSLKNYIRMTPRFGSLLMLSEDAAIWTLDDDEVARATDILAAADMIIEDL